MDAVIKWMSDNQVLSGIGGVALTAVFGVIAYFYKRRRELPTPSPAVQQSGNVGTGNAVNVAGSIGSLTVGAPQPASLPAENIRVDVKEAWSQRRQLFWATGGFDIDLGRDVTHELWLPAAAELKIICHNLTATPATLDVIRLLNVDSNQEVGHWDGNAERMGGFDHAEVKRELPLDNTLPENPPPPQWRGIIEIVTVRGGRVSFQAV